MHPEILSPCGSTEALNAALRTGCDAVYLGGKRFSARANAANFTYEELKDAVRLCHVRGVKVYQAINTVVTDRELPELKEAIREACELGIDGIITQDLAVVYAVRELCPDLPIHASTQMTLHTRRGMLFAKELGFSRAVASRELPENILRELCGLPVEIEVFVHGALCMSVSGQCYMSAVIGSRSANRGQCAQACRLPVSCMKNDRESHALSLKDMSHIPHLRALEDMGAASLKIEGRMKRPEYVAAATDAVRSELDGKEYDQRLLEGVFSRSGFTDGYFTHRMGRDMFGYRRKEDVEAAADALPALHELYRKEYKRAKAEAECCFRLGEKSSLKLTDEDGVSAEIWAEPPQKAVNRPMDEEYARKQLSKLGDTVYELGDLRCRIDPGVTVPASQLNDMRRRACAELDEARAKHNTPEYGYENKEFVFAAPKRTGRCGIRICIHDISQVSLIDGEEAELVYADPENAEKLLDSGFDRDKVCAVMPRFTFDEEKDFAKLKTLADKGLLHIECTNYAHISMGRELGLVMHGGFGLNVTNTAALHMLKELGLTDCVVSFELKASEIRELGAELPFGVMGYGRLPMMLTVNCPIKAQRGCKGCTGEVFDRTGRRMPVKCTKAQGYVEILNSDILSISDKQNEFGGAGFIRLDLYDESPERVKDILRSFACGEKLGGEGYTKGLYVRGISN